MKKILTFSIVLLSFFVQAQERSSIAVSYGFGNGVIGSLGKSGYGYSHNQKSLNILGLNYWHEVSRNLFFETGMQLFRYTYVTTSVYPNVPPANNILNMISVPFKLRFEAGDYIFFNGGLTADISRSRSNRIGGIGAGIGIGLQVKLIKQVSLYVNPQANIHGILPSRSLFAESNIAFGVSYQIPKL